MIYWVRRRNAIDFVKQTASVFHLSEMLDQGLLYGKAGEIGGYWTRTAPQGPLQSVVDSALDQNWKNTATNVARIPVPSGTRLFEAVAAPQRGFVGGGNQIYIRN